MAPTLRAFRIPDGSWLFVDGNGSFVDAVAHQLDPYVPHPNGGDAPLLTIRERTERPSLRELQNLAGDGWMTGSDGDHLFIVAEGRTCSVPDGNGLMEVESGFPTRRLMSVVRPALQLALLERGTSVLHAACVEVDGRAVLVAGWSESGKTETALALVERGASFLSDKWTLLLPGARAGAFPIGVGIRRWVLQYLPQLRSGLPRSARTQLRAAAVVSAATAPIRGRSWRGPLGLAAEVTRRAVELGDRAGLSPTQVRAAYGDTQDPMRIPPIGLIAVLRNSRSAEVVVEDGNAARLAIRLAVSAATEREPFMALRRRAAYAEALPPTTADIVARDAAAIEPVIAGVPLVEVTAPFPTDPREVAREIAARL
ncbi:MAG: hypothetical protein M3406_15940 [Chloroflexota bacterium]|nr:hypothetical protein [Chloroflexota bacterium]